MAIGGLQPFWALVEEDCLIFQAINYWLPCFPWLSSDSRTFTSKVVLVPHHTPPLTQPVQSTVRGHSCLISWLAYVSDVYGRSGAQSFDSSDDEASGVAPIVDLDSMLQARGRCQPTAAEDSSLWRFLGASAHQRQGDRCKHLQPTIPIVKAESGEWDGSDGSDGSDDPHLQVESIKLGVMVAVCFLFF